MTDEFVTKTLAIKQVRLESGYGRYVIEQKMRELLLEGKIVVAPDPARKGRLRISQADLQVIITALTGEL